MAAEANLAVFGGALSWLLLGILLAQSPRSIPVRCPIGWLFIPVATRGARSQLVHLLFHQYLDYLDSGLANQFPDPFVEPANHLGHWQHPLYATVSICSSPLFPGNEKLLRAHQAWSLKLATFYDLPGIPGGLLRMA